MPTRAKVSRCWLANQGIASVGPRNSGCAPPLRKSAANRPGTSATVTTDLVSFARSKGAYAGLSLQGFVIRPDGEANSAFYGRAVSPPDILIRGAATNPAAAPLQQSLRAVAR